MKTPNMITAACALALIVTACGAAAEDAGLRVSEMRLDHYDKDARVAIWYPAEGTGATSLYADSPIFQGVNARPDARIAQGRFPVVLFSHGMGGTDRAQAWLGAALAQRGAIVVMVNHPNSTWGDFDMTKGVKHWTRAADLSAALDRLTADPEFGAHIDAGRIMAAGFSYGGWTALSMGGVTGNLDGLVTACQHHGAAMEACDMLLSDKVNLPAQNPALWNARHADARVTQVAAIDPGFVWGLEARNTKTLVPDVLLIGLGDDRTRMSATNFAASGLADLLPKARVVQLAPAFHFTAMPLCTPKGAAILEEEHDDPVCTDPTGTDRAAVHAEIVAAMAERLGL